MGAPDAVISLRALTYMLSLVPDAALGAGALRQALFDFGQTAYLTDVERFALRIIRASGHYNMPWARRRVFEAELDKVIHAEAVRQDVKEATLRKELATGHKPSPADDLIITAVKNMALRDTATQNLEEAEKQIRKLEAELADLRKYIQETAIERQGSPAET